MPRVTSLFRHPVKGFTAEACEELTVQADGRVAGDRVLAFRFADAVEPEHRDGLDHWPKSKGLALQDFPSLAALRLAYDAAVQRMRITHGDAVLVEAGLDPDGRAALEAAVTDFVLDSAEARRLQRPGRLPLVLVGDGVVPRFQDRARGFVSLHSTESAQQVGAALGQEIDDRRFRSNVVIEGAGPWDELGWQGEVRIGDLRFTVAQPLIRCLATHADPDTGVRDANVLTALTGPIGQAAPTLGVALLPIRGGGASAGSAVLGSIRIGDEVLATG